MEWHSYTAAPVCFFLLHHWIQSKSSRPRMLLLQLLEHGGTSAYTICINDVFILLIRSTCSTSPTYQSDILLCKRKYYGHTRLIVIKLAECGQGTLSVEKGQSYVPSLQTYKWNKTTFYMWLYSNWATLLLSCHSYQAAKWKSKLLLPASIAVKCNSNL